MLIAQSPSSGVEEGVGARHGKGVAVELELRNITFDEIVLHRKRLAWQVFFVAPPEGARDYSMAGQVFSR